MNDAKEEKIAELIEQNDVLENYFRNTIIPQLFIDGDMILQKFTPPAMKQFSLKLTDVGRPIEDIKENFRFPSIIDNIKSVIESNEILEKEIQTTDFRWYQMNIIPYVRQKDKKTNGVIITFVEITARIKDLKEQEKLIADHEILLDTISHDIKGPLTTLVVAINLFKNSVSNDPKEFKSLLGVVENAGTKLQQIISELVDTRKEEHKYKAEEELLNFEHILEDVRLTLTDDIMNSGAVIKTNVQVSELTFSRRKLRSIVYNLVSNAIKFNPVDHKPEILISTEKEEDFIVITIKDNATGIEEDKQESIFSKYYRIENSIEGSGIGLYLVKEIVTTSGGKIELKSEPGKGSEFKVYLKNL
ncbi:MAG TPA: ATP-binding protein [Chitinophagaceae bacterium]|nr:ATP-binding protein [Chitinophagaceae bacterium]